MNTTLQPTTPRMGDMINLEGMNQYDLRNISLALHNFGAVAHESIVPSLKTGYWLCWTENNTLELGEESEHVECLSDANLDNRIIVFDRSSSLFLAETIDPTSTTQTAYADNINYYKRMIQQGTYPQNKLTRDQALQKLGYWEGRYDELTAGGREE